MNQYIPQPFKTCVTQYLGTWDPDFQYMNVIIQVQPTPYWTLPVVKYLPTGINYVMNGTAIPTLGMAPDTDSAWDIWGGSGGGGNFLGYWLSATNSPTLANGTGIVGTYYTNTSPGTNIVNFGAGNISFNQNDNVQYNASEEWINVGQASGISNVISATPDLLAVSQAAGVATLTMVNQNQAQAISNVFYYGNTDNYVNGAVTVDISLLVLNRDYGVYASGGNAVLTPVNGTFFGTSTVSITNNDSIIIKAVTSNQANIY